MYELVQRWDGDEQDGSSCSFPGEMRKNWFGSTRGLSKGRMPDKERIGAIKTKKLLRALEVLVVRPRRTYRTGACIRRLMLQLNIAHS